MKFVRGARALSTCIDWSKRNYLTIRYFKATRRLFTQLFLRWCPMCPWQCQCQPHRYPQQPGRAEVILPDLCMQSTCGEYKLSNATALEWYISPESDWCCVLLGGKNVKAIGEGLPRRTVGSLGTKWKCVWFRQRRVLKFPPELHPSQCDQWPVLASAQTTTTCDMVRS